MTLELRTLDPASATARLPALAALLVDAVAGGAGVNFMQGFDAAAASAYWQRQIDGLATGDRIWLVAEDDGAVAGTVMCLFAPQPNQPFRGEVSKMLVHSGARRRGVGAALMRAVEEAALAAGRTLLVLDTTEGSAGDRLYRRQGWTAVGTVPDYAYLPDGTPGGATIFYKRLASTPAWRGTP